jgi:hypothetical protein
MRDLEDDFIKITSRNRDLRMNLLLYAEELDEKDGLVDPKEVAAELIKLLNPKE